MSLRDEVTAAGGIRAYSCGDRACRTARLHTRLAAEDAKGSGADISGRERFKRRLREEIIAEDTACYSARQTKVVTAQPFPQ